MAHLQDLCIRKSAKSNGAELSRFPSKTQKAPQVESGICEINAYGKLLPMRAAPRPPISTLTPRVDERMGPNKREHLFRTARTTPKQRLSSTLRLGGGGRANSQGRCVSIYFANTGIAFLALTLFPNTLRVKMFGACPWWTPVRGLDHRWRLGIPGRWNGRQVGRRDSRLDGSRDGRRDGRLDGRPDSRQHGPYKMLRV